MGPSETKSVSYTIIGSDNGLSPVRRQAIIWINGDLLLIGPLHENTIIFVQQIDFENVVCKMAPILVSPQCVNPWSTVTYTCIV